MIEILQKFEEESTNHTKATGNPDDSEDEDEDEDEDGPNGLVERFASVDLDSASEEAIWAALTPEERKKFLKALEDPTSQLAQDLLASSDLDKELEDPWWEASTVDPSDEPVAKGIPHKYGSRPPMMTIPQSMIKPVPSGHPLVYNMCSICIAYAYITRSLATSPVGNLRPDQPEYHETVKLLRQMVPFLSDRKSATLYPNLADVITDIWSSFEPGKMTNKLFALLLKDAASLLKPRRVSEVTMDHAETQDTSNFLSSHPHERPLLVLSDLRNVCSKRDASKQPPHHTAHKIVFYAAHIASTPTFILERLAEEIEHKSNQYSSMGLDDVELPTK
ncbi:hypothetical protein CPB83DRAFT_82223 [Crepidotus variabilis]|uniref:Uncharacterized protein n=1 Tax=Crepidotus variabilis TaxID=179855 RepID=A0A9P6JT99_9AGAR|nr:hypothetical protein CPB83DRAFT_82223 [Crepidotus variabilis]